MLSWYLYLKIKKKISSGRYCKKTYLPDCFPQFHPWIHFVKTLAGCHWCLKFWPLIWVVSLHLVLRHLVHDMWSGNKRENVNSHSTSLIYIRGACPGMDRTFTQRRKVFPQRVDKVRKGTRLGRPVGLVGPFSGLILTQGRAKLLANRIWSLAVMPLLACSFRSMTMSGGSLLVDWFMHWYLLSINQYKSIIF